MSSTIIEAPLSELNSVAREILKIANSSAIIILKGDLASGKTTLSSAIAKELTSNSQGAVSPTFALQHIYSDRLFHYDLYRVSFEEIATLGLLDEFDRDGIHLIEWADDRLIDLLDSAGYDIVIVDIAPSPKGRRYEIYKLNA